MRKSIVTLFLFLFVLNVFAQEKDIYSTFFKDPEKQLATPITSGGKYYSSYNAVTEFLNDLAYKIII